MQVVIFGNIKNKSSWRDNNHAFFISFYDNRFIVVYPIFNYFPSTHLLSTFIPYL